MRIPSFPPRVLRSLVVVALTFGTALVGPASAAPGLPTHLLSDMVTFDRAYIAALALTSQEKPEPSQKAMRILVPTWAAFQAKYIDANPNDPQWRPDLDAVGGMIERADGIVRTGSDLVTAHDELEDVRMTLMHLRERNGIPYYVDPLTRFHEPMEAIVLAGKGKSADTLSPADLETIRAQLPHARTIWAEVSATPFDAALFGFTPEKQAALQKQIVAETDALTQLQMALDSGDPGAIAQRAVALKPSFSVLFMMFGDFDGLS